MAIFSSLCLLCCLSGLTICLFCAVHWCYRFAIQVICDSFGCWEDDNRQCLRWKCDKKHLRIDCTCAPSQQRTNPDHCGSCIHSASGKDMHMEQNYLPHPWGTWSSFRHFPLLKSSPEIIRINFCTSALTCRWPVGFWDEAQSQTEPHLYL